MSRGVPVPAGRHGGEVSIVDLRGNVRVPLDGMKPGATVFTVMPDGGKLAGPAAGQANLRALSGSIGGPAGRRPVLDLRVDLDDPPEPPRPHPVDHRSAQQRRVLDTEAKLGEVVLPR